MDVGDFKNLSMYCYHQLKTFYIVSKICVLVIYIFLYANIFRNYLSVSHILIDVNPTVHTVGYPQ